MGFISGLAYSANAYGLVLGLWAFVCTIDRLLGLMVVCLLFFALVQVDRSDNIPW